MSLLGYRQTLSVHHVLVVPPLNLELARRRSRHGGLQLDWANPLLLLSYKASLNTQKPREPKIDPWGTPRRGVLHYRSVQLLSTTGNHGSGTSDINKGRCLHYDNVIRPKIEPWGTPRRSALSIGFSSSRHRAPWELIHDTNGYDASVCLRHV